jgi:hypothetical protein
MRSGSAKQILDLLASAGNVFVIITLGAMKVVLPRFHGLELPVHCAGKAIQTGERLRTIAGSRCD